jgi:hypothetical protein
MWSARLLPKFTLEIDVEKTPTLMKEKLDPGRKRAGQRETLLLQNAERKKKNPTSTRLVYSIFRNLKRNFFSPLFSVHR